MKISPRAFALSLICIGAALFSSVVALNFSLDPQGVFGTRLIPSVAHNDRFQKMRSFTGSDSNPDVIILGSSRGHAFNSNVVSAAAGTHDAANLSVYGGLPVDFIAAAKFVQMQRPKSERSLLVLIDADRMGENLMNKTLQTTWPPEMIGESNGRFLWRYLTAVQFKVWKAALRISTFIGEAKANEILAPRKHVRAAPAYKRNLEALRALATFCKANNINLVAALTPLHKVNAAQYDAAELEDVMQDISAITPVWYFGTADWMSDDQFWTDRSHFTPAMARMIADRIFRGELPTGKPDFGVNVQATAARIVLEK